jgi:Cyclin, N-terminal domain/Cyclin, C-terminal domain
MIGVHSTARNDEMMSEKAQDGLMYLSKLTQMLEDEVEMMEGNLPAISFQTNELWRNRVVQWFYNVVDHFGDARSVVYIAVYILDCYCAHKQVSENQAYQLCSLSALFLAFRISGSSSVQLMDIVSLSQISRESQDFIAMGKDILSVVKLCKHIKTPHNFVRAFAEEIVGDSSICCTVMEEALYNCDLSVSDFELSHKRPSEVAAAAIASVIGSKTFEHPIVRSKFQRLMKALDVSTNSKSFRQTYSRLRSICDELHEDQTRSNTSKFAIIEGQSDYPIELAPILQGSRKIVHVISMDGIDCGQVDVGAKRKTATNDYIHCTKSRRIE